MINTGIIHGQCARNEFRRKNPSSTAKLFEGRGLGYGTIPQLARNGLGKRPVVRPFCHCETNRRCSVYSLGEMRGTPYVSPRITTIGMHSLYLSLYFSEVAVPSDN